MTTLVPCRLSAGTKCRREIRHAEFVMPVSAYIQAALFVVLNAVALFAAAGTVQIPGFWVYVAIVAAVIVASFAFLDPGLLRERMRPGGQRPPLALRLFGLVLVLHWIIAGLDRGRFHWSDDTPAWLQTVGLVAVAAGYALTFWAMRVNRFFSSVVRIQSDRGQYVITTGPYRWIRHPGYLAGIVIMVASGIALGSWLSAAILIVLSLPFLLHRAITEDRVLQAELPGYRDYAARVRWRVLPGIW
jgi:protein-S-isoprenylcysteine O-methyltransferase Ste14